MGPVFNRLYLAAATTAGAVVVTFGLGAPPERCPTVTVADVRGAASAATGWLVDHQRPDGRWLYEYDRVEDAASDAYNIVRHAGVTSALYQAAANGDERAFASADLGLAWALDHVVERHGWAGVTTTDTVQAGTNALLVTALVERRALTGDDRYDPLLDRLGRFLTSQVEPSGALLAYYDLGPDRPRPDTYSIYYTGEAYWALGRLHRLRPEAGWGAVADRVGHYIATERDDVEDIWPPLADHWSGYGLAETAAFPERPVGSPLTDDELELVRRQGGLMGQRVRSISQRFGPWGPVVRGTFTPRGGGYGVFGEGLTGLWRAAQLDDRLADERSVLAERAICIVGLAIDAQADATEAARYPDRARVEGAWFIDDVTRMDDQQHALSALLLAVPILEAAPADGGHPAPATWLWLAVLVGVLNPLRVASSLPIACPRRERIVVAVLGAAAGAGLLLAVGASSGAVLDATGASRPSVRLAIGGVCVLSAAIDLVRRASPVTGATGRAAALVPVAVPLVARPALVVAGLSVVADRGVAFHALSLAVVVTTVAATAVAPPAWASAPDGTAGALWTWASRLVSVLGLAAGALLIADAVFDI